MASNTTPLQRPLLVQLICWYLGLPLNPPVSPDLNPFERWFTPCGPPIRPGSPGDTGEGGRNPPVKAILDTGFHSSKSLISKRYADELGLPYAPVTHHDHRLVTIGGGLPVLGVVTVRFYLTGYVDDGLRLLRRGEYQAEFIVADIPETDWPKVVLCSAWCSDAENFQRGIRIGLIKHVGGGRGERAPIDKKLGDDERAKVWEQERKHREEQERKRQDERKQKQEKEKEKKGLSA